MSANTRNVLFLKLLLVGLFALFVALQIRLWFSDDGYREVVRLENQVETQRAENEKYAERNARLEADVTDLKDGNSALEERARADLGMVDQNEDFFLFGSEPPVTDDSAP